MRFKLLSLTPFLLLFISASAQLPAASFSFSCVQRDTVNGCGLNCVSLSAKIPNIKALTDAYVVNRMSAPEGCFRQYVSPASPGNALSLNEDDVYSGELPLPFDFPFYGTFYAALVVSGNGYLSFDVSNAGNFSHYSILSSGSGLTSTGTGPGVNLPDDRYDRALIMGPYHDLNAFYNTSPDKQVKLDIIGTAPHRRWIVSYNKIPLYSAACQNLIENTHQIVLYEGTGIVEVFVNSKQVCANWNAGKAIIGMQDYNRTKGIMAPGRAATDSSWGTVDMNESWRFTPAAGPSLLKKVELYKLSGELVATGDTLDTGNGMYHVNFSNVCAGATSTFVVKSTYQNIADPFTEVYGTDTLQVTRLQSGDPIVTTISYPQQAYCNTGTTPVLPTIAGLSGGIFSVSPAGLNIDSTSGVVTIPDSDTGLYTINYRIAASGTCPESVATTNIRIVDNTSFVWTGAVSNEWENPLNWSCNNLPISTSNVFIYGGNVLVNSNVTVNSLTVQPGASLDVSPGYNVTVLSVSGVH